MILSERTLAWLLRLFPPLFFNRVWVKKFGKDFRNCEITVYKSLLNRNLNGTIFGGTIFSSADPIYAVMYWQIFARENIKVQTWLKSAKIDYLKPGNTNLYLSFYLSEQEVDEAFEAIRTVGKFVKTHRIEIKNKHGEICVIAHTEVYIRQTRKEQKELAGF